jgi:CheY-like chemotaxis protein
MMSGLSNITPPLQPLFVGVCKHLSDLHSFSLYTTSVFAPLSGSQRRTKAVESEKKCILVVEDDAALRQVICRTLSRTGSTILEAQSGAEALELISAEQPDIVILDLRLPQMSGSDVLKHIYADPAHANTRVLVLTASTSFDPSILRPDDQYLIKPAPMSSILTVVHSFLSDLSV